ncbi:hypothetical protein D3C77_228780 [compost metagenome]|jgi:hypothetical protein
MTERELIYRHETAAPWSKNDGASLILSVADDGRALSVKFVYWPAGRFDNTAQDPGGLVFDIL